jgi:DNA-binding CsgD family transcriptional regulator
MLLGRDGELARLDSALADARLGTSSALVIRGEPGIGKSALLRYAVERAESMRVLSARGVQFESDVPFAGLHELLRPALEVVERLPPRHASALRSSLALGERVESDRLVIGAATLELITTWADAAPVVVAVDDAQWFDDASAQALAFAARRLLADPIALLVVLREGEPSPLLEAGLPELELRGLDAASAMALLESAAGRPLAAEVRLRVLDATGGNPLALVELAHEVDRFGSAAADAPLPVATTVERAYLRRAVALSGGARKALLIVAASGTVELPQLLRAATELGVSVGDVEEAESADGLAVVRQRRLEFVHPLARAAIYHSATPADRRAAHRAMAAVLADISEPDRRAWHLAASVDWPDEGAAEALEEAAGRARERTAHGAAAAALEEAARLTTISAKRGSRLLGAAENAWLAGQAERAVRILEVARSEAADDALQAELDSLGAQIMLRQGAVSEGYRLAQSAAVRLAPSDRTRAVRLLADVTMVGYGSGKVGDMLAAGRRALDLLEAGDEPRTQIFAHVAYGVAATVAATGAEGPRHLHLAADLFGPEPAFGDDPVLMLCAGAVGLFLREVQTGRELLQRVLAVARERAPAAALPAVLCYLGRDAATTDRWTEARGRYEESVRVGSETTQFVWLAGSLSGLAWLDALEGREAECRAHAAEALDLSERYGVDTFRAWSLIALGLLELGLGQAQTALGHLLEVRKVFFDLGVRDPDMDPAPDLVEAYLRLGRVDEARVIAEGYEPSAAAKEQPFALARACRAQALVASDAEFTVLFEGALDHHERTPDTFERARTQLAYGERLRRARRRTEARSHLADALELFDRLGATPWSRRALVELGASGQSARPRNDAARQRLTPQELQVALSLAEGRTTREAAAALFLSPKTVEYHLRNVYSKLAIRSREELHAVMGERPTADPGLQPAQN